MDSYFKFEKLIVWQKTMEPGGNVNDLSERFPGKEVFDLTSQICPVSDSIALNISEGNIGQSVVEQKKLTSYTDRLLKLLHASVRLNPESMYHISKSTFDSLYSDCFNLMSMLIGFRNKTKQLLIMNFGLPAAVFSQATH